MHRSLALRADPGDLVQAAAVFSRISRSTVASRLQTARAAERSILEEERDSCFWRFKFCLGLACLAARARD